jgi:cytochrome c553
MRKCSHRVALATELILGLVSLALAGCVHRSSSPQTHDEIPKSNPQLDMAAAVMQTIQPRSPEVERGQQVVMGTAPCSAGYTCYSCFQCHGIRGEGGATAALPRLAGQNARYMVLMLDRFASGERKSATMSEVARALTEQQRHDVAAYYAAVTAPKALAPPMQSEADAQLGRNIDQQGMPDHGVPACMTCHGAAMRAQGGLPYPYLAGQYGDYLDQQLMRFRAGERRGQEAQVMQVIARSLSAEQGQVVSTYLAGQPPPQPPKRQTQ